MMLSNFAAAQAAKASADRVRVGVIGVGNQGRVLVNSALKIPGVRFTAACDIWPYHSGIASRLLKKYDMPVNVYGDYQEMLDKEKDLDAVIVATPDWMHAEHAIACLKAGRHVYCEKEMSNSLDDARRMVLAARETKKLLQIGHQRRSNPRYLAALDLVRAKKALGRPVAVQGCWNRSTRLNVGFPQGTEMDAATLKKYGYDTMEHLCNWRWYRKFSGGPIADLGSHQIDIFNWFLAARPRAVLASGGRDFYEDIEWYDTIDALYEWDCPWDGKAKPVRGFYQLLSTSSHGGYVETFIGDEGSMIISEDATKGGIRREEAAEVTDWEKALQKETAKPAPVEETRKDDDKKKNDEAITIAHSVPAAGRYYPPIQYPPGAEVKPVHRYHLENFFSAVRDGAALNCPAEAGYDTAVTVLRANEAVASNKRIEFSPAEFTV